MKLQRLFELQELLSGLIKEEALKADIQRPLEIDSPIEPAKDTPKYYSREIIWPFTPNKPFENLTDAFPAACRSCSNHPINGGSGICNCTLSMPVATNTAIDLAQYNRKEV